jgi:hypothetical protein
VTGHDPNMSRLYIVVGIGCLECRQPSELVGVFTDRDQALAAGPDDLPVYPAEDLGENDWHGDGLYGLYAMFTADLPPPGG